MKKQGFIALALVVTTAAIASAFAPVPRPIESTMTSAPAASSGLVAGNTSFEIRHAPVPILMQPRSPLEQPIFDADAVKPALVAALPATASDRVGDSAATGVIKVASVKHASGANGRYASDYPTAGGARWAP
jgi:hypothetical protein